MKKNLKINIFWLGLVLIGYLLMTVLVSAGVLNAFYIQILEQIGINIFWLWGLISSSDSQANSLLAMLALWLSVPTL